MGRLLARNGANNEIWCGGGPRVRDNLPCQHQGSRSRAGTRWGPPVGGRKDLVYEAAICDVGGVVYGVNLVGTRQLDIPALMGFVISLG